MKKLAEKIKNIPKPYFSFFDLLKISDIRENSLKVALSRLVKKGELVRIMKGWYAADPARVDWEVVACRLYAPSYLSYEWVLARAGVLSQQPAAITLATVRRGKIIESDYAGFHYHRLKKDYYWGYDRRGAVLAADKEKALLDLAYLARKGYASFDAEEMNLKNIDRKRLAEYLKKFRSSGLENYLREKGVV